MRKGIIVAVATLAMGLTGLFATPAKALQFGFNAGYTSVGFQLHGMGGEFLLGLQGPRGEDDRRPQGSVLRIGLASATGMGETDLTKAIWNGESVEAFKPTVGPSAIAAARAGSRAGITAAFPGGEAGFTAAFPTDQAQQAVIDQAIAASLFPEGAAVFDSLPDAQKQGATTQTIAGITATTLERALLEGYSIDDITKAKGDATAFFVSAAYEYVLAEGAPGLGFIVGGELYVSQGGYSGNTVSTGDTETIYPSASTKGGIGGGGVVGISYYLKNGFNMTVKTGLGVVDPGEVVYNFAGTSVKVEPETVFYASPTFALGFIY